MKLARLLALAVVMGCAAKKPVRAPNQALCKVEAIDPKGEASAMSCVWGDGKSNTWYRK